LKSIKKSSKCIALNSEDSQSYYRLSEVVEERQAAINSFSLVRGA